MKIFIVVLIVSMILGLCKKKAGKKDKRMSQKKFTIKTPIAYFWLGALEAGMMGAALIWGEINNELNMRILVLVLLAAFPGLVLMIAPLPGICEVRIDGDAITSVKVFIFKKKFEFPDITHGKFTRGGLKVYVKNRRRKAFFADGMMNGTDLLIKRLKKAEIPLEEYHGKEE